MSSLATARSQIHRKWHACVVYNIGKCQLTWNCQCDDITPLSWGIQVLCQLSHAPVVSTVGHGGTSNPVFTTCWDCVWVGTAPFILPLSVIILYKVYVIHSEILQLRVCLLVYVTPDSDHLTTKYKRPVGLQWHNSLVGNCKVKINRCNFRASQSTNDMCPHSFCEKTPLWQPHKYLLASPDWMNAIHRWHFTPVKHGGPKCFTDMIFL